MTGMWQCGSVFVGVGVCVCPLPPTVDMHSIYIIAIIATVVQTN